VGAGIRTKQELHCCAKKAAINQFTNSTKLSKAHTAPSST